MGPVPLGPSDGSKEVPTTTEAKSRRNNSKHNKNSQSRQEQESTRQMQCQLQSLSQLHVDSSKHLKHHQCTSYLREHLQVHINKQTSYSARLSRNCRIKSLSKTRSSRRRKHRLKYSRNTQDSTTQANQGRS